MSLIRIVPTVVMGVWLAGLGFAQGQTAPQGGAKQEGVSQPRAGDAANRAGGTKRTRQPQPQPGATDDSPPPSAEDERMNRALNGICRGC